MIQNILRHLGSIDQYGVVSLCLFGLTFLGVLAWAFLQSKSHLDHMARVPLEIEPEDLTKGANSHE